MTKPLTCREIADRIDAHLKRIEADPTLNPEREKGGMKLATFWRATAGANGSWVFVYYFATHGATSLTRADAERYLQMLDAGFVGRHFEALRQQAEA